jgi:hypothetical protein
MPNITIRDVPESVHRKLTERAERNRQSLQQYLLEVITEMTDKLTMDEWLDRVAVHRQAMPPITGVDSVALIKAGRLERETKLARLAGIDLSDDDANIAGL